MPTYNRASFLPRSIESVVGQEFSDWELIVVDDGSTDGTGKVLDEWQARDGRVKCFFQENRGISAARNAGLGKARGRFICFLDSDDAYRKDHLSRMHGVLSERHHPDAMVVMQYDFVDELTGSSRRGPQSNPQDGEDIPTRVMSVFLPCSPPVQTISHPNGGSNPVLFDPRLKVTECYDYCARLASRHELLVEPHSTVILYGHRDNVSVKRTRKEAVSFYKQQFSDLQTLAKGSFYKDIRELPVFKEKLQALAMRAASESLKAGMPIGFLVHLAKYLSIRPQSLFGYLWLEAKRLTLAVGKAA